MKNIQFDLLVIVLLVGVAAWTQFHASGLPLLMGVGLIPLFGSVVTSKRKITKRQSRPFETTTR